ncbi:hypothetical protein [Candidatus Solirubrobacter pratensis]|uniref:hypothetical protein n=1 Tax=Candidatus Solirubrobacter pratensis TaxID=1298857 RepID=UPI00041DC30F|nr:hypothetical protein [Candidatus Solirubrobacter pratensis]
MPVRLLVLITAALVLVPAAGARAAWIPAQPIDGNVTEVGGIDLAREGTGAVAYLRVDGDGPHVFVSRLSGGAWQPPVRIDPGLPPATEVKVAVGDGNRIAVAWVAGGSVFAASTPVNATPAPFSPPVAIGGPGARSVDVDLGVNDAAYAVWQQSGDVRAARLQDTTWSGLAAPVDINPAAEAGTGALRPRVAVSAEGYAVVTWGEVADRTRVYARRLTGLTLSAYPQQVSQDADGGNADSPDIDIEDDGSFAWVVYRQDTSGGSRSFARRLVGSTFDPRSGIDPGPSAEPRIDMSGKGQGEAVAQGADGSVFGALLDRDVFDTSYSLGWSPVAPKPEVAATDRGDLAVAWRAGPDARGRIKPYRKAFLADTPLSNPALGPVADPGVFIGGDRVGDFSAAFVQDAGGVRTLSLASYDDPPGAPFIGKAEAFKRQSRPELKWRPGVDLWGAQTFRVYVDGVLVGQTKDSKLTPAAPLKTGRHTWQVEAVDLHGQTSRSRARTMKIDATAPALKVRVSGKRGRGQTLKIKVTVRDRGGSGLDHTTIDFGDKSATTRSRSVSHRYRAGSFKLKVAAVDKAGNVARKEVKLRIKS